jgi:hypothetical protein
MEIEAFNTAVPRCHDCSGCCVPFRKAGAGFFGENEDDGVQDAVFLLEKPGPAFSVMMN